MSDYKDAVAAVRSILPPYVSDRIKETGFKYADGTLSNDPTTGAKDGYLWVHGFPRGANVQVIAGPNINPRIPEVLVWVGTNYANQAVAHDPVTDDNAVKKWGATFPSVGTNPPPIDFAVQELPLSMMGGGRVLPLASTTPGLTVYIEAFPEAGWAGGNIVVSGADLPTNPNEFRWAVFYFPEYTGTPVTPTYALTTAVVKPTKGDLLLSDAANLVLTAGVIRGGAVSLAYAQTDLTADNSRFENELRRNFVPEGIVKSIVAGTNVTVDNTDPAHPIVASSGGGGGTASLLLDYAASTDLFSATSITANTWTDVNTNQSFTVSNASAVIEFAVVCNITIGGGVSMGVALRLVIDSAGTPVNIPLHGGRAPISDYGSAPGGTVKVSSLSAAAHTVKIQVQTSAASTAYLRASSVPIFENLAIQVAQFG